MSIQQNQAAWMEEAKAHPFIIKEAPYPRPQPHEIVIRTKAVGINPFDMKMQTYAFIPIKYPFIFGVDVAGDVVEVGSDVTDFKKGDRVLAQSCQFATSNPSNAVFQHFTAVPSTTAAPVPSGLSYAQAAVLPVCFSTAAMTLFSKDYLGLSLPSLDGPSSNGKTVFIWGGASAVGSNSIQLAKAAGYEVFTTASAKNFEYCKALGADMVFDYTKSGVNEEIVQALKGKNVAGAYDTITTETVKETMALLEKAGYKGIVGNTQPTSDGLSSGDVKVRGGSATVFFQSETAPKVWREFLPKALEQGKYQAKPDAFVAGHGLESVQGAVDMMREGVSAKKVVVTL